MNDGWMDCWVDDEEMIDGDKIDGWIDEWIPVGCFQALAADL